MSIAPVADGTALKPGLAPGLVRHNRPMSQEIVRRRLLVQGRVQGVFFRDSTRARARQEAVTGWARNRFDGAVEIVLEGPEAAVERVAAYCERGPRGAVVRAVQTTTEPPEGLTGFEIR